MPTSDFSDERRNRDLSATADQQQKSSRGNDAWRLTSLWKGHAAALHSCKYRWLHAPATKTLSRASRKSGGPFFLARSRIYPGSARWRPHHYDQPSEAAVDQLPHNKAIRDR